MTWCMLGERSRLSLLGSCSENEASLSNSTCQDYCAKSDVLWFCLVLATRTLLHNEAKEYRKC